MAVTIDGTNGITSPDFEPSSSTTPTNGLFLPTTNALGFATNSTERLRLDASGNLGLGVTPQTWSTGKAISVGYSGSNIWSATESGNIFVLSNAYYNGGYKYDISGKAASYYQQNSGIHSWYNAPSGTAGAAISFTQAMTLDASGNLGIGTTSPTRDAGTASIGVSGGSSKAASIDIYGPTGSSGRNYAIYTSGTPNNGLQFYDLTASAERARIDSSGNLLVGTTSAYISGSGNAPIQIAASGTGGTLALRNSGATAGKYWRIGPDNAANNIVVYNQSNAGVYMTDGSTSWTGTSDERLKTDLKPIENAAQKVSTLRAVTGRFRTDDENKSRSFLIAQDVQKVLPEAVSENDEGYLGIAYTDTIPLLVAAIKELTARLEALENK